MTTATLYRDLASFLLELEDEFGVAIELETATDNDSFLTVEELIRAANRAVNRAEQLVHTIYEDYLLTYDDLTLVSDQDEYDMPSNIWAMKFRKVIYNNGSEIYEVNRASIMDKFLQYQVDRFYNTIEDFALEYMIVNTTPTTPKMVFSPVPKRGGNFIRRWYLRQANRFVTTADQLDIPEASNYMLAYLMYYAIKKDRRGNPGPEVEEAKANLMREEQELVATLTAMVPDGENRIEADMTHYVEHN